MAEQPRKITTTTLTVTTDVHNVTAVTETTPTTHADDNTAIAAAVAAMAAIPDTPGRYAPRPLTELWLRKLRSPHTARAYRVALDSWCRYCAANNISTDAARPADLDDWVARARAARGWSAATVNAKLAAVSSWYAYLIKNKAADNNPAASADRADLDPDDSRTTGVDTEHVAALLDYLEHRASLPPSTADPGSVEIRCRDYALIELLLTTAMRSGGAAHAVRERLTIERGHRILRFRTKAKTHTVPLEPASAAALDCYLAERDARHERDHITLPPCSKCKHPLASHLFLTAPWRGHRGDLPLSADQLGDLIRRHAANAGIPGAAQLVPHSLRHTAITAALDEGIPLSRVQDLAGHVDPRTTRIYDRNRDRVDQSPVYDLGRRWARHRNHHDTTSEEP